MYLLVRMIQIILITHDSGAAAAGALKVKGLELGQEGSYKLPLY